MLPHAYYSLVGNNLAAETVNHVTLTAVSVRERGR